MSGLLRRLKERVQRGLGHKSELRHDWREVSSGPLSGLWLYLPTGVEALWVDRFLTSSYEPEMMAALRELADAGGTLYDIGAHIGYYTCAWLKLGGDRVEAFEPALYNREILKATLQRNGLAERVQVHGLALGDRDGEATLLINRHDVGAASNAYLQEFGGVDLPPGVPSAWFQGLEDTGVTVRRLDSIYEELALPTPAVLKLDIEGAEAAALAGAEGLLARWHPAILCEVHTVEAALAIADSLAQKGYRLQVLGKNGPHIACLWSYEK